MTDTYTQHAEICASFYECTVDANSVSDFLLNVSRARPGAETLFVGGMFHLAKALIDAGLNLTCVDYTDQMVELGKTKLPGTKILKADLRSLPFDQKFELIFVVGRVFTHMISEEDLASAVLSCKNSLLPGGSLIADNYEDIRIQSTSYFNGLVTGKTPEGHIARISTTKRIMDSPLVVEWNAVYSGKVNGKNFSFQDSMPHRAFSRDEFKNVLENGGFKVMQQGDNFDETSFYSLARKPGKL